MAAGRWQPPELVGLCEVENAQVLEDLIAHPILARFDYAYLHRDGPDHRGMEVACLFRPERFDVIDWRYVDPVEGEGFDQTREMLYLQGSWGRKDSLGLFLVHFISRYRGSGQTASYRRSQAERLTGLMDSVACRSEGKLVLAACRNNNDPDPTEKRFLIHVYQSADQGLTWEEMQAEVTFLLLQDSQL